jgi:hypothetical protein
LAEDKTEVEVSSGEAVAVGGEVGIAVEVGGAVGELVGPRVTVGKGPSANEACTSTEVEVGSRVGVKMGFSDSTAIMTEFCSAALVSVGEGAVTMA